MEIPNFDPQTQNGRLRRHDEDRKEARAFIRTPTSRNLRIDEDGMRYSGSGILNCLSYHIVTVSFREFDAMGSALENFAFFDVSDLQIMPTSLN